MRISNGTKIVLVAICLAVWTACGGGDAGDGAAEQAAADQTAEMDDAGQADAAQDDMGQEDAAQDDMGQEDEMADGGEDAAAMDDMAQAELPEGVTPEMIEQGRQVFTGAGLCYACHGQDGKGMPGLGADLTDDEWLHIDGSLESIITNINQGVTAEASSSGTPMPPRGGSGITDEQVRAVAAYVYTLSQ